MEPPTNKVHGEKETGRLEAFSDGVFAIAITLLVLDLKAPDVAVAGVSAPELAKALLRQWPSYVGLVTRTHFKTLRNTIMKHAI